MKSLSELMMRREIALECIRMVSTVDKSDPRRAPALEEYNRQLAEIDAEITKITGKPPATTIGLKAATLTAQANKVGGQDG